MLATCLGALGGAVVVALWFRRIVWRVRGPSMGSTIPSGSLVVLDPLPARWRRPQMGDIVIVRIRRRGRDGYIVKRIASVLRGVSSPANAAQADSHVSSVFLKGDDEEQSLDSRHFGAVPIECVKGYVVAILRRPGVNGPSSCATRQ